MPVTPTGNGGPAGQYQADRATATHLLSQLLKQLHQESGRTWDELAAAAHVSRNTVRNYLGDTVRRRDRTTVESLLDAMTAPDEQRALALRILPYTWDDAAPPQSTAMCLVVGQVPELADAFQGRDEAAALWEAARPGTATVLTQGAGQTVVSGLGGVGKTQLAAHWARYLSTSAEVDLLVWVGAATATGIVTAYADTAVALKLPGVGDGQRDLAGDARRLLVWLATTSQRWAVVLDNLDDPVAIRELWPPVTSTGRTVVTTRRRDATLLGGRAVVDVDLFTTAAAVAFLLARLPPHLADDAVAGVAEDLGRLPLALAHAAAYMTEREMRCARYRERFAARRKLIELFPDQSALFDDAAATVANTWALSIEAANVLTPQGVAGRVLELASLLDPAGVPLSVLTASAALTYCGAHDPDAVEDAVTNLHRFSLVTRTADPAGDAAVVSVGVHALVQRAVREHLDPAAADSAARTAADALLSCWPDPERDPTVIGPLRTNTFALRDARNDALWTSTDGGHPVLFRLVTSLHNASLIAAAATVATQFVDSAHSLLGPDHRDTLATRHEIAYLRGDAGDAAGAAAAFEQLLPDQLRVAGPDHHRTLDVRHALAYWRGAAGNAVDAVAELEQVLSDRLRLQGPDHSDTLTARANLASFRGLAGDAAGAAAAFEQVLSDRLRMQGPDHRYTLIARAYRAYWRGAAGDPAGAVALLQQVLSDQLRVLGPGYPDTLTTRHDLAHWRGHAGDPAGAAAAFDALLTDRLRVLGADHPDTIATRGNLAYWRREVGDSLT